MPKTFTTNEIGLDHRYRRGAVGQVPAQAIRL